MPQVAKKVVSVCVHTASAASSTAQQTPTRGSKSLRPLLCFSKASTRVVASKWTVAQHRSCCALACMPRRQDGRL